MKYSSGSFIAPRVHKKCKDGFSNPNSKQMVEKVTKSINKLRLYRVNQFRTTFNGMNSGNRISKADAWNLAQTWGIGIERVKKMIPTTTHNSLRDATIPLTK